MVTVIAETAAGVALLTTLYNFISSFSVPRDVKKGQQYLDTTFKLVIEYGHLFEEKDKKIISDTYKQLQKEERQVAAQTNLLKRLQRSSLRQARNFKKEAAILVRTAKTLSQEIQARGTILEIVNEDREDREPSSSANAVDVTSQLNRLQSEAQELKAKSSLFKRIICWRHRRHCKAAAAALCREPVSLSQEALSRQLKEQAGDADSVDDSLNQASFITAVNAEDIEEDTTQFDDTVSLRSFRSTRSKNDIFGNPWGRVRPHPRPRWAPSD